MSTRTYHPQLHLGGVQKTRVSVRHLLQWVQLTLSQLHRASSSSSESSSSSLLGLLLASLPDCYPSLASLPTSSLASFALSTLTPAFHRIVGSVLKGEGPSGGVTGTLVKMEDEEEKGEKKEPEEGEERVSSSARLLQHPLSQASLMLSVVPPSFPALSGSKEVSHTSFVFGVLRWARED